MKRLKNSGNTYLRNVKTGFFSQLLKELRIDACLFKNLLIAFFMNLLTKILFDQEGVGWVLNFISDVYLVTSSFLLCALNIKKGLKHLLKN